MLAFHGEKQNSKLHKNNSIALFLLFTIAVFFVGLRDTLTVGCDSKAYRFFFEQIVVNGWLELKEAPFEIGFVYYSNLCSSILDEDSIQIYFLITALISLGLTFNFFRKYSDSIFLTCVFFVLLRFYDWHFTAMRQVIAVGLILQAYPYVIEKRLFRYAIVVTLATMFHFSSIIFAPFYCINFFKLPHLKSSNILFSYICFVPLFLPLCWLVNVLCGEIPMLNRYTGFLSENSEYHTGIGAVLLAFQFFALFLCCVIYSDDIAENEVQKKELYIFSHASFVGSIAMLIATVVPQFGRATWYFTLPICVLLPNILLQKKKYGLLTVIIIFLLASYIIIHYYKGQEWSGVYPYRFYWDSTVNDELNAL